MDTSSQMILPQTYFFCNGRITGFIVSLNEDDNDDVEYPYIQVWRNVNSSLYTLVGQYQLQESDIRRKQSYFIANAVLSGTNRIEFQSRDIIGYYHPPEPRYRVWSVENTRGYTIYGVNTRFPLNMFIIRSTSNSLSVSRNERPLIQALYGNRYTNII